MKTLFVVLSILPFLLNVNFICRGLIDFTFSTWSTFHFSNRFCFLLKEKFYSPSDKFCLFYLKENFIHRLNNFCCFYLNINFIDRFVFVFTCFYLTKIYLLPHWICFFYLIKHFTPRLIKSDFSTFTPGLIKSDLFYFHSLSDQIEFFLLSPNSKKSLWLENWFLSPSMINIKYLFK